MYTEQELVAIAKRENNNKRKYLVVNRLQGKHIPVSPAESFKMFHELALTIKDVYNEEKLLLIGFAETATAIGAALAAELNSLYMQTTRENIANVEYLYFSEAHSHATEQKLVKDDIDKVIGQIDRIVFVEDEVTTGNTIMDIINVMKKTYNSQVKFAVASLLNGMSDESISKYRENNINIHYLVKTDHSSYTSIAEEFAGDGEYIKCGETECDIQTVMANVNHDYINPRRLTKGHEYKTACTRLYEEVKDIIKDEDERILVLGTEEMMYPAMFIGRCLEEADKSVKCHATTRSPIAVSSERDYPLHRRYELRSLYDYSRITYIYELEKYDKVIIITDSTNSDSRAVNTLVNSLLTSGNDKIYFVEWQNSMRSSYKEEDVEILLKDITGMVEPQTTKERETLIQSGRHYCEMLPIEYVPSEQYMEAYRQALKHYSRETALAVGRLADKIINKKGKNVVLVSLARAGIPIGILLKRYIGWKYGIDVKHYSISIIRGRGIDNNAMRYILGKHRSEDIQFVDGWIGKGAILNELKKDLCVYDNVSTELAVISDPANVTELCGTHKDILIASSCLNSTVSGLISRTFLRDDIIGKDDFHGAVYYGELKDSDLSYEFINSIQKEFEYNPGTDDEMSEGFGVDEVKNIASHFGVDDINLVKPGIGETTRVLLRRVPWKILISDSCRDDVSLTHIIRLASEKSVKIEYYPLHHYKTCGIIKKLADT